MLHSIQALRAIAAAGVTYYHCVIWLHQGFEVSFPAMTYSAGLGAAGVHIFFVVSGFIMMWTNQDCAGDWTSFLRKRFSRIYPSYWLVAFASIPLALLINRPLPTQPELWLGTILLLPKGASALIDVGWTLAYEVYFYSVFALLIALRIPLFQRVIFLGLLFTLSIALGLFWQPAESSAFGLPSLMTNGLLLEFSAGAFLGWAATRPLPFRVWHGAVLVVAALLGFGFSLAIGYDRHSAVLLWGAPSVFLVAGAVILERNRQARALFQALSPLGDSSYALYLIHAVLIPVIVFFIPPFADLSFPAFLALVGLLLVFNLILSHMYYLAIETRLIRASNSWLSRGATARP
ncbi:acyltransferase [Ruegeria sp.]|uniref:acyltransferase family protein n=1 Tax=Ruegeria sp. TaxID=1879320 RepID=UPI002309E675|nr:acyltransferase [Ruegeria sp.]MDA7965825.1 acyltransferase [Ruegeria sp.]